MSQKKNLTNSEFHSLREGGKKKLVLLQGKGVVLIYFLPLLAISFFFYYWADGKGPIPIDYVYLRPTILTVSFLLSAVILVFWLMLSDDFCKNSFFKRDGFYVGKKRIFTFEDVVTCFPAKEYQKVNGRKTSVFFYYVAFTFKGDIPKDKVSFWHGVLFFEAGRSAGEGILKVYLPYRQTGQNSALLAAHHFLLNYCTLNQQAWDREIAEHVRLFCIFISLEEKGLFIGVFNELVPWGKMTQIYPAFPECKETMDDSFQPEGLLIEFVDGFYSDFLVEFPMAKDSIRMVGGEYDGKSLYLPISGIDGELCDWEGRLPPPYLTHQNWKRFKRYLELNRLEHVLS